MRVSILVLVDVALERIYHVEIRRVHVCFNPCSRGCRSGTNISCRNPARSRMFQSLFSWMSLWNVMPTDTPCRAILVSILVLVDVALEQCRQCRSVLSECVSILVLVDVALEQTGSIWVSSTRSGFNPCSRGCRSGTECRTCKDNGD